MFLSCDKENMKLKIRTKGGITGEVNIYVKVPQFKLSS